MRVELIQPAANVLFDVPDEMHKKIIALIDAITKDTDTRARTWTRRSVSGAGSSTPCTAT
ncbi:hypothetical protein ACWD00_32780 [Streptomyces viridiviolaceus]